MAEDDRTAIYEIVRAGDGWMVRHDQDASLIYATREAAFEAAVPKVSLAVKQGYHVRLEVAAPAGSKGVQ